MIETNFIWVPTFRCQKQPWQLLIYVYKDAHKLPSANNPPFSVTCNIIYLRVYKSRATNRLDRIFHRHSRFVPHIRAGNRRAGSFVVIRYFKASWTKLFVIHLFNGS